MGLRSKLVCYVAVALAIGSAVHTIVVKHEAEAVLEQAIKADPVRQRVLVSDEEKELLKTRIGLLQATLNEHGLLYDQPAPDDGLTIPGVYPQLIYDRQMRP